jgi:hypothetical protein
MHMRRGTRQLAATVAGGALAAMSWTAAANGQAPAKPPAGQETARTATAASPSLVGRWELNFQQSDPMAPEGVQPAGDEGGRRGGSGGRGATGGGAGTAGGGAREGGEGGRGGSEPATAQDELQRVIDAQRVLIIEEHDGAVSITDADGRLITLKPDGIKVKDQLLGTAIERTTKWDGRTLVSQSRLNNGVHITQSYTKVNEGLQLVIATKVEGGRFRRALEFKRVYDQAFQ